MADLSALQAQRVPNSIAFVAADPAGDTFTNSGREAILIRHDNALGASVTLTIATPLTIDGLAVADASVVIGPGETHLLGPWPASTYNDSQKKVALSYSDATDISIAIVKVA